MTDSNTLAAALLAVAFAGLCASSAGAEAVGSPAQEPTFTVCADPANLPYSNKAGEGFENRIAALLAADMKTKLEFFWFAEHKGFLRRTLLDKRCDAVISVPQDLAMVATTRPYFASSYVAVTRAAEPHRFLSFDDAWLREARIGLQMVGNEGATTPPAIALSRRGLNQRLTAFAMWSERGDDNPQGKIVDAVATGKIDVAFVWGPFAGFFMKSHEGELRVDPVTGDPASPDLQFVFPMSIGVRKSDAALRDRLQDALDHHAEDIAAILREDGVPTVGAATGRGAKAAGQ